MNSSTFALSSQSTPPGLKSRRAVHSNAMVAAARMRRQQMKKQSSMSSPSSHKAGVKFQQRPIRYLVARLLELCQQTFQKEEKIDEFEAMLNEVCQMSGTAIHRKQQELNWLIQQTNFTKQELKMLYWGWKVACPEGILDEKLFKDIYAQFFPQAGDASIYAHFVFNAMFSQTLADNNGQVTFTEYVIALSNLCRGSLDQKIRWIFTLYDINKDGRITYDEVLQISVAIYALLGFNVQPLHNARTYEEHARKMFAKLDVSRQGFITYEQFKEVCSKDENIVHSMEHLDIEKI